MALNETPQPVLQINKLTKYFGGLSAVKDFDLVVNPNNLVGLIGPTARERPRYSI